MSVDTIGSKPVRNLAARQIPFVFRTATRLKSKRGIVLAARQKNLNIQKIVASYADVGVRLKLDKNIFRLSQDGLRRFIEQKKCIAKFGLKDMFFSQLIRSSRQIDKTRNKAFKKATYYGHNNDIFYFQVCGDKSRCIEVDIKDFSYESMGLDFSNLGLFAVQRILNGDIDIFCPICQHQYSLHYFDTLGNYAHFVSALKKDYKEIHNDMKKCCCKHVLEVLHELKSKRMKYILIKKMRNDMKKSGCGDIHIQIATDKDQQIAQGVHISWKNKQTFRRIMEYEREELIEYITEKDKKAVSTATRRAKKAIKESSKEKKDPLFCIIPQLLDNPESALKINRTARKKAILINNLKKIFPSSFKEFASMIGIEPNLFHELLLNGFAKKEHMSRGQLDFFMRQICFKGDDD